MSARFFILAACAVPFVAAAAPDGATSTTSTTSRITRVTVYPGVATVERVAPVATEARRVVFECLPAGLDAQNLSAHGSAAVQTGEISVRVLPREQVAACVSPLQAAKIGRASCRERV